MRIVGLLLGTVLLVVSLGGGVQVSAQAPDVLCRVDIGVPGSETGHSVFGWGPVEPARHPIPGVWGSGASTGANFRVVYSPLYPDGYGDWARVVLDRHIRAGTAKAIRFRHLDGISYDGTISNDSFDVYIMGRGGSYAKVFDYTATGSLAWRTTTVDITRDTDGNPVNADFEGGITVIFVSTAPPWANFGSDLGQVAFDWIELLGTAQQPATIGDFVWKDSNANGIQNAGEPGVSGVTVNLFTGSGAFVATAVTDANGFYRFTVPAGNYYVGFVKPGGYTFSPTNQGDDPSKDSDADAATWRTAATTLSPGKTDLTWDCGLVAAPKLEGNTPGFWKNHAEAWAATGYATNTYFDSVFGVGPHITLMSVLGFGGGGEQALMRHAVAAILNAAHPRVNYVLTVREILDIVQDAFASEDYEPTKDILDTHNNLGADMSS